MDERPRQVCQDAETTVQLCPGGTSPERVSSLLSDELLRSHARLVRREPDRVLDGLVPGQRRVFAVLEALDLRSELGGAWRGSAELCVVHYEAHDAPAVEIRVTGFSGLYDETNVANMGRVAWRLGDALEHAFHLETHSGEGAPRPTG